MFDILLLCEKILILDQEGQAKLSRAPCLIIIRVSKSYLKITTLKIKRIEHFLIAKMYTNVNIACVIIYFYYCILMRLRDHLLPKS